MKTWFDNDFLMTQILLVAIIIVLLLFYIRRGKQKDLSGIVLTLFFNQTIIKGKIMAATITDTQFIEGTLETVNKKGQPAPVELGSIEYSSSNEAVFTVTENADDEKKFTVTAVGAGTGQLNYSADADLGEGVVTISGFTDIIVTPGQATGFNVTFGTPQEQP